MIKLAKTFPEIISVTTGMVKITNISKTPIHIRVIPVIILPNEQDSLMTHNVKYLFYFFTYPVPLHRLHGGMGLLV